MSFYRNARFQVVVWLLFQILSVVCFRFSSLTMLGFWIIIYVFSALWGNIGYIFASYIGFWLILSWFISFDSIQVAIAICGYSFLYAIVPAIFLVALRNAVIHLILQRKRQRKI
jgi:hypothetical protein